MSGHTPGPWYALRGAVYSDEKRTKFICNCFPQIDPLSPRSEATEHSNARIMAAAPDLLSAGKAMIANVDRWIETGDPASPEESEKLVTDMKAAIAKAEGKYFPFDNPKPQQ